MTDVSPCPTAPQSPSLVAQYTYPIGWVAGSGPGSIFYDLSADTKTAYFGFWWKCSSPWQTQSAGNKLLFIKSANLSDQIFLLMRSDGLMNITIEWDLSATPAGTRAACSLGEGQKVCTQARVDVLDDCFFAVGMRFPR